MTICPCIIYYNMHEQVQEGRPTITPAIPVFLPIPQQQATRTKWLLMRGLRQTYRFRVLAQKNTHEIRMDRRTANVIHLRKFN